MPDVIAPGSQVPALAVPAALDLERCRSIPAGAMHSLCRCHQQYADPAPTCPASDARLANSRGTGHNHHRRQHPHRRGDRTDERGRPPPPQQIVSGNRDSQHPGGLQGARTGGTRPQHGLAGDPGAGTTFPPARQERPRPTSEMQYQANGAQTHALSEAIAAQTTPISHS